MFIKRVLAVLAILFIAVSGSVSSEERNIYTIFYNNIKDDLNIPLVGFVNIARGNHSSVQLGFSNFTADNFAGAQAGFVNTSGGLVYGVQNGFVNSSVFLMGVQNGFVNLSAGGVQGVQNGFVNMSRGETNGLQNGFVNFSKEDFGGAQIGFTNLAAKKANGLQAGFANITKEDFNGAQLGFVNFAGQKLRGAQIGFINIADTVESGIPFGFLSFVKRGGYKAVELGFSNHYPFSVSFKTGIEKFYTSIILAGNPNDKNENLDHFAFGFGIGSILSINERIFINPELTSLYSFSCDEGQLFSFAPLFGVNFTEHFGMVLGPSLDWQNGRDFSFLKNPIFEIADYEFDRKNIVSAGVKAALRFRF